MSKCEFLNDFLTLRRSTRLITNFFVRAFKDLGMPITFVQFACLVEVQNVPSRASVREVSTQLDADKGAFRKLLKELAAKGLVETDYFEDDRSVSIRITNKGNKVLKQANAAFMQAYPYFMSFVALGNDMSDPRPSIEQWNELIKRAKYMRNSLKGTMNGQNPFHIK